jgi:hypothetical protein
MGRAWPIAAEEGRDVAENIDGGIPRRKPPNVDLEIGIGGHERARSSGKHGPESTSEKLELGTVVNWEKAYWRVGAVGHDPKLRRNSISAEKADVVMKDGGPVVAP